jgi:acetyltransferase-like isoleucine patch superfamily enzyme
MILKKYHGIQVGAYSYGECLNPGSFPNGVTVGRYVSIGGGVRIFLRNHPMDRLSMHPFFYNKYLGFVKEDTIGTGNMEIGHDAWIGERAVITSGCTHVGIGAVIGASSVVTKDVPDFAIVAGNPARIIRYRFPEEIRKLVLESRWWELSIDEIAMHMNHMVKSIRNGTTSHPLLHEIKLKGKYCEH